jgi:hypothetical protein
VEPLSATILHNFFRIQVYDFKKNEILCFLQLIFNKLFLDHHQSCFSSHGIKIKKEDLTLLLSLKSSPRALLPPPPNKAIKETLPFSFLVFSLFAAGIESLLISSSKGMRVEPILLAAKKA